jgi:hypothetical protein
VVWWEVEVAWRRGKVVVVMVVMKKKKKKKKKKMKPKPSPNQCQVLQKHLVHLSQ